MKQLQWRTIAALIPAAMLSLGCEKQTEPRSATPSTTTAAAASSATAKAADRTEGWQYSTTRDEMRQTETRMAALRSINSIQLAAPYNGGSSLSIVVSKRSDRKASKAMLMLSNGQLACVQQQCRIEVRFDDQPIGGIMVTPAGGGFTDTVFLDDDWDAAFVRKLKTTSQLIVEVPVYQAGLQQFKFDTTGLTWD